MRHFIRAAIVYRAPAATHLVEVDEKGVPLGFTAVCGAKMSHPKQVWGVGGDDPVTCPRCTATPLAVEYEALERLLDDAHKKFINLAQEYSAVKRLVVREVSTNGAPKTLPLKALVESWRDSEVHR